MNMKNLILSTLTASLVLTATAQAGERERFRDYRGDRIEQRVERIQRLERRADRLERREARVERKLAKERRKLARDTRRMAREERRHDRGFHRGHDHAPAHGYRDRHDRRHDHNDWRYRRYLREHRAATRVYHSLPRPVTVIEHTYPRPRVETHVVVDAQGHGNPVRTLAGGLIGGVIAHELSEGNDFATATGAITGAIIANRR